MKRALIVVLGLTAASGVLALPPGLSAQTKAAAYKSPRTSFGQPDLGGTWSNASLTPESRPAAYGDRAIHTPQEVAELEKAMVEEVQRGNAVIAPDRPAPKVGGDGPQAILRPEYNSVAAAGATGAYDRGWLDPGDRVMRVNGQPRTSLLTTPNGRPPARKASAPVTAPARGGGLGGEGGEAPGRGAATAGRGGGGAGNSDDPERRTLSDRCVIFGRNVGPPMQSNGFYNNNYRFVQGPTSIAITSEMIHDTRVVRLNSKHRTDGIRPWFGDSIGKWEGDTLVVETTNFPQAQAYQGSWQNLTVIEKFRRVAPDRLYYQYIIRDPTFWDADWGGEYEFQKLTGEIYEYACHEGNYAMENMLAGARAEERARAGASR